MQRYIRYILKRAVFVDLKNAIHVTYMHSRNEQVYVIYYMGNVLSNTFLVFAIAQLKY